MSNDVGTPLLACCEQVVGRMGVVSPTECPNCHATLTVCNARWVRLASVPPVSDDVDLEVIEDRLAKATQGPWHWQAGTWLVQDMDGRNAAVARIHSHMGDTDLIAHAPTDLRALLDEVRRLRAKLERVEDFRVEIAIEAFTAPDADWDTILDSLRSRLADALHPTDDQETSGV